MCLWGHWEHHQPSTGPVYSRSNAECTQESKNKSEDATQQLESCAVFSEPGGGSGERESLGTTKNMAGLKQPKCVKQVYDLIFLQIYLF